MCSLSGSSSRCCCWRAMMRVGEPSKLPPDGLQVLAELLEHASRYTHARVLECDLIKIVDIFCCTIAIAVRMLCYSFLSVKSFQLASERRSSTARLAKSV